MGRYKSSAFYKCAKEIAINTARDINTNQSWTKWVKLTPLTIINMNWPVSVSWVALI
jgi:hypothetical protein